MRYKAVKVATLDFISEIVFFFFTHQLSPPNAELKVTTSQDLSDCRWCSCTLLVMVTDKERAQRVLCTYKPYEILLFC